MRLTIFSVIFPIFLSIRSNTPLLLKLKIPSSDTITWSESPMPSCLQTASRFAVKRASSELGCALPDGWEWRDPNGCGVEAESALDDFPDRSRNEGGRVLRNFDRTEQSAFDVKAKHVHFFGNGTFQQRRRNLRQPVYRAQLVASYPFASLS